MVKIIPINVGKTRLKNHPWLGMESIPPIYGDLGMVYDCFTHINENNNGNNNNNVNGKLMVNIPHYFLTHINIIN